MMRRSLPLFPVLALCLGAGLAQRNNNSMLSGIARLVGGSKAVAAAPINLVLDVASPNEVVLTWDRVGTGETNLQVQRSPDGVAWVTVATLPAGSNVWTDASLFPAQTYFWHVGAAISAGVVYSGAAKATTSAAYSNGLANITNLTATANTPTTATLTFTDTNKLMSNRDYVVFRSADGGNTYSIVGTCGYSQSGPYQDTLLTPGVTYNWVVQDFTTTGAPANRSNVATATMPGRISGHPIEPTGTAVSNTSGTTNVITWTDTNAAASYKVYRANWTGNPPAWKLLTTTGAGATTYTDSSCLAEHPYSYEVTAHNGIGDSAPDQVVSVNTASQGSSVTIDIGPGQPYTSIKAAATAINTAGPGSDIRVHGNGTTPYNEFVLLACRGTAANPITSEGINDGSGNRPILDATSAVWPANFAYNFSALSNLGLITLYHRSSSVYGYQPGYLIIKNFEIRNCYDHNAANGAWTDYQGHAQTIPAGGQGIFWVSCDNTTVENCSIHDNGEGIIVDGYGPFYRVAINDTFQLNTLYNNGEVGSSQFHNIYWDTAVNTVFQYNSVGPERSGALGSAVKARGAGDIIRYNSIENSASLLDIVEPQNGSDYSITLPGFYQTEIYGNILKVDDPRCAKFLWFGGDHGNTWWNRKGGANGPACFFWSNTCVCTIPQSDQYYVSFLGYDNTGTGNDIAATVDARNNVFYYAVPGGGTSPLLNMAGGSTKNAVIYFGTNWIQPGWSPNHAGAWSGNLAEKANLVTGSAPGFLNYPTDLHPTATSPFLGLAGILPANLPTASFEYPNVARSGGTTLGGYQ